MRSWRRRALAMGACPAMMLAALVTATTSASSSSSWQLVDEFNATHPACYTTSGGTNDLAIDLNGSWSVPINIGASGLPAGVSVASTPVIDFYYYTLGGYSQVTQSDMRSWEWAAGLDGTCCVAFLTAWSTIRSTLGPEGRGADKRHAGRTIRAGQASCLTPGTNGQWANEGHHLHHGPQAGRGGSGWGGTCRRPGSGGSSSAIRLPAGGWKTARPGPSRPGRPGWR
jgi:hypothetical protein